MGRFLALTLVFAPACEGPKTLPACVDLEFDPQSCAPLFVPQFERIHEELIQNGGCASESSACHVDAQADGAAGGLIFGSDADADFQALAPFLDADPACGPFAVRLNSDDAEFRMPPGQSRVDEGVRCAVAQWMAQGAPR